MTVHYRSQTQQCSWCTPAGELEQSPNDMVRDERLHCSFVFLSGLLIANATPASSTTLHTVCSLRRKASAYPEALMRALALGIGTCHKDSPTAHTVNTWQRRLFSKMWMNTTIKGNTNSRPQLRPAGTTETGDNTAELVANTRAAAGGQLSRNIDTIRGLRAQTVALI